MKTKSVVVAAAGVLAISALVYATGGEVEPPGTAIAVAGEVVAEEKVTASLADNGCSFLTRSGEPGGRQVVVLASRTGAMAGMSMPTVLTEGLAEAIGGGDEPVGSLTLITVGGADEHPRVVLTGAALTDPKAGRERRGRLADKLSPCLGVALDASADQQEAGSDELLGQQVAARAARAAAQQGSQVRVFVVSDGEANAGLFDIRTQDYPYGNPLEAVDRVHRAGQLPDYLDVPVDYFGIGQHRNEAERAWLSEFHRGLCEAGGGVCTVHHDLVPVKARGSDTVPADPPLEGVTTIADGPKTVYRVDSASFHPGSTELVDADALSEDLRRLIDTGVGARARKVSVIGHACDDGSSRSELVEIADRRADTIAELLIKELGIDRAKVAPDGRGADDPIAGPSDAGVFSSADCAANRRVEIVFE